jgi:hypothetical protein
MSVIRKSALALLLIGLLLPTTGHAQMVINMSRVTCADYLAMDPEQSAVFGAWIGGYFNQKTGYTWIDLEAQKRNVANVTAWCATNPGEFVMAGIQRATQTPGYEGNPNAAAVRLDMNQITCQQFIDVSYDKAIAIGAWMSGYWNAQRGIETLDVSRYKANAKRVSNYCKMKKNRKQTLMATIEKVAR